MWTLAQTNGIVNPNHVYVGQRLTIPGSGCQAAAPAASGRVHVVQYGENLTGIAQRYGVNVWTLAKANGMSNLNFVYAGQRLTIPGAAPAPAPAAASSAAVSTGPWQGAYYNGTAPIGGPILTRNSRTINFHWGLGSPDARVPVDGFSARWASTTNFVGGVYRFTLTVDDGAKVWVDEQQVLDVWKVQAETTYTFDVTIAKGNHVITIEYFDESGTATIQFSFKRIGNAPRLPRHRWGMQSGKPPITTPLRLTTMLTPGSHNPRWISTGAVALLQPVSQQIASARAGHGTSVSRGGPTPSASVPMMAYGSGSMTT